MTKKEIVLAMVNELELPHSTAKDVVQMMFDAIINSLVDDGRIELRNFGVFEVKRRAARKARNPKTGGRVNVPEKLVVTFKPGKEMEQRVNSGRAKAIAAQSTARTSGMTPDSALVARSHNG